MDNRQSSEQFRVVNSENRVPPSGAALNGTPSITVRQLSKEEYAGTIRGRMAGLAPPVEAAADVWAYIAVTGPDVQVTPYVYHNQIIEDVLRSEDGRYDHVIIPCNGPNIFVSVIVDRTRRCVHGHYLLDFNSRPAARRPHGR